MIKVLIVDDHEIFLQGLVSLLQNEKDIEVVGTASDGKEAIEIIRQKPVDVAVLDIRMPGMNGLDATLGIKKINPSVKVLALTSYNDEPLIIQMKGVGCSGYILKNKGFEELADAIHTLNNGNEYYGQEVMRKIMEGIGKPKSDVGILSKREIEVLKEIALGLNTPKIADKLNISQSTVDTHRKNMLSKLKLSNSMELVRYAMENGLGG